MNTASIARELKRVARERAQRIRRASGRNPKKKRKAPSKETQIKMVRGALKSPRTPRQFIPSLRKRLAKLTAVIVLLATLGILSAQPVRAQYIGNAGLLTFNVHTVTSCAVTASFNIPNLGLTVHTVNFTATTPVTMTIQGGNGTTQNQISDMAIGTSGSVVGTGYYPVVQVSMACINPSTVTTDYSGTIVSPGYPVGTGDISSYDYVLATAASAGVTQPYLIFPTPYGSTGGIIYLIYTGAGPANSTIDVTARTSNTSVVTGVVVTCNLATTTLIIQTCIVPPFPASTLFADFNSGGASTTPYLMEYVFNKPGSINTTLGHYTHVTGTTATAAKAIPGTLLGVSVNTAAAGTISVFDLATAACTGTPSTNTVAVITINATDPPHATPFNVAMQNGICTKASVGMDYTVESQ